MLPSNRPGFILLIIFPREGNITINREIYERLELAILENDMTYEDYYDNIFKKIDF